MCGVCMRGAVGGHAGIEVRIHGVCACTGGVHGVCVGGSVHGRVCMGGACVGGARACRSPAYVFQAGSAFPVNAKGSEGGHRGPAGGGGQGSLWGERRWPIHVLAHRALESTLKRRVGSPQISQLTGRGQASRAATARRSGEEITQSPFPVCLPGHGRVTLAAPRP